MLLAALQQVEKSYAGKVVLDEANFELREQQRVALIGRNGAGKSTILRILAGLEPPDAGSLYVREGCWIGMLEQDLEVEGRTVLELCEEAFAPLDEMERQLAALEQAGLDDPDRYHQWELLHETFERRGGYARRARRDAVLHALEFRGREQTPADALSGGELTRLGLARLLMAQPDLLLLDEPTNHLDLEMRGWLEQYLGRYPGGVVIVSHDRDFLDGACDHTAEIAWGRVRTFPGTPTAYRKAREEQERIEARTRGNQERERARLEASAKQMKLWAGQNAKLHRRAKAMERRLERYEAQMLGPAELAERTTRFAFDCDESGEIVVQARHLSKSYQRPLFRDVAITIRQGERIALLGPNGAGKSTFLRVLLGDEASDDPRGMVRFGARVRVGYYDQQLTGVDEENTLLAEVVALVGDREAHNLLGRFLFPFDAQFKQIRDLSGGERARLALLKLTLGNYNLLVLDEPTNHLDVEMIEALEAALQAYRGTLLVVSHDRRFVGSVCSRIWDLRDGKLTQYEGDLGYYLRKRAAARAQGDGDAAGSSEQTPATAPEKPSGPSRWQLERTLEAAESRIEALEQELAEVTAKLATPEALTPEVIAELGARHASLEAELLVAMNEWEQTSRALEERGR